MGKTRIFIVCFVGAIISSGIAQAAVVDIMCRDWWGNTLPEDIWRFDYDSQVLMLNEIIWEIGPELDDIAWYQQGVYVVGSIDSDSTFTIVKNITNMSCIPLNSYSTVLMGTIVTSHTIVEGSAECTKLPEVNHLNALVEFTGPDPILYGQSFTIQFDIWNPYFENAGRLDFSLNRIVVPEPATICFLIPGGLILFRKRKR